MSKHKHFINKIMDKTIHIEHTPESLLENGRAFISYYCYLTGQDLALINLEGWDNQTIKEYERLGFVIHPNNIFVNRKYKAPKGLAFINKIEQTYDLLENFIRDKCEFSDEYKISAAALLKEFAKEIDKPVNCNKEFPALMSKLMNTPEFSHIEKKTTSKCVVYLGLRLKSNNNAPENNRPNYKPIIDIKPNVPENATTLKLHQESVMIPPGLLPTTKSLVLSINNVPSKT